MKNNNQNVVKEFAKLVEKILKFKEHKIIKKEELKSLDKAIDAVKDSCSKGELISYLVIGLSNNSDTTHVFNGTNFTAIETMSLFFKALIKDHKDLGEDILKRLKSDFDEKYSEEEDDDEN
jgi:hypothetical protein